MKELALEVDKIVSRHAAILLAMTDEELEKRRAPDKWSTKEIIGHLIDSAQNNIQRFVRAQYEDVPRIVYAQNDWVYLQQYQHCRKEDLVELWVVLNKHLCRILTVMHPARYGHLTDFGKTEPQINSISFVAKEYLIHLLHHLNQIESEISTI